MGVYKMTNITVKIGHKKDMWFLVKRTEYNIATNKIINEVIIGIYYNEAKAIERMKEKKYGRSRLN